MKSHHNKTLLKTANSQKDTQMPDRNLSESSSTGVPESESIAIDGRRIYFLIATIIFFLIVLITVGSYIFLKQL